MGYRSCLPSHCQGELHVLPAVKACCLPQSDGHLSVQNYVVLVFVESTGSPQATLVLAPYPRKYLTGQSWACRFSKWLNARVTAQACQWLMGPCKVPFPEDITEISALQQ